MTELVGVTEIGALAGVTKQAVSNWRHRHDSFPRPIQLLSTGPVWDKEAIVRWIKGHQGEPTHVISFINLKGGVGKTTVCTAVAEMLAKERGKHVLVIDLDPQTNATVALISEEKWAALDEAGQTIAQIFVDRLKPEGNDLFDIEKAIVRRVSPIDGGIHRLELLASSIRLIDVQDEVPLIALKANFSVNPLEILKRVIAPVIDGYDYVLIDCPPSLGAITKNGLRISSAYVIPTIPDVLSTWGIYQIVHSVDRFAREVKHDIRALGIVASKVRGNDLHRRICEDLKQQRLGRFSNAEGALEQPPLFSARIPDAVDVARGADVDAGFNTPRQRYGSAYNALSQLTAEIEEKCQQMTSSQYSRT
ncbi:MAG: AAA family ATPase [Hyphomonadaceae bacterium]